jgi:hypothetical protein
MQRNMRRRLAAPLLGGFGLLLGGALATAHGQPKSLHDIPWYMANNAARAATINLCRSDHRFARDVDCLNAETAEDRLWGQRAANGALPGQKQAQGRSRSSVFDDDLLSPQFWADNRLTRIGALASCKHPPTVYTPDVCAAAQQGDALDAARRGRR